MTRRLGFALLAMTVAQAAVYVVRPLTSYRLLGIGAGPRDVGLVAAAFAVVPLFLAVPLGRHSDRRGGARLLVVGCAVQTLACLLLAVADTALALAACTALLGVGHLGLALGSQDVIARESAPERHDQHFGLLTAGVSLGQLVGPLLGGFLLGGRGAASLAAGTTRAMLVAAVIAAVATLAALVAEHSGGGAELATPAGGRRGSIVAIASARGVPAGILASVAVLAAADVFTAYLPVIGEQHGIGPRAVGALLAVRAAASIASRIGIGAFVRHIGRLTLIMVSAAGAAVALAAMTFTDDLIVLAILSAVAGFGLGFGQPLSMTMVVRLVPAHARSTVLALRLTGNRLGQAAAPAAAGLIAGGAGAESVFWLMSGMLLASAAAIRRHAVDPRVRAVDVGEAAVETAVD